MVSGLATPMAMRGTLTSIPASGAGTFCLLSSDVYTESDVRSLPVAGANEANAPIPISPDRMNFSESRSMFASRPR